MRIQGELLKSLQSRKAGKRVRGRKENVEQKEWGGTFCSGSNALGQESLKPGGIGEEKLCGKEKSLK